MDATGSFTACQLCQTKHCCTKLGVDGLIERAVLTPSEKARIERVTGISARDFAADLDGDGFGCSEIIARPDGRCTFLDDNKMCTIYDLRPIDCRLFPFDIAELDGRYYWIVYDKFCQLKVGNWEEQVAKFEQEYLPELSPYLREICTRTRKPSPDQAGDWRLLRPVAINVIPSAA
jgi:Fe-S-cluster containining protein